MKIIWHVSESDTRKIKEFIALNDNDIVRNRQMCNVDRKNIVLDKDAVLKAMLMSLLTSQQRSGPNTRVGRFGNLTKFPVTRDKLEKANDVQILIKNTLQANGLTRFLERISIFFTYNYQIIQNDNWDILSQLKTLDGKHKLSDERQIADDIDDMFKGFGPKQSRNFLQSLGLTKYEIPLDSRITKWLKRFGFPVTLNSAALSDKGYYHFVSDGLQILCEKAGIYPCIFDAAVFSSFDTKK